MKITVKLLAKLGLLPLLAILSVGSVSAQTDLGKTIMEKLTARVAKLERRLRQGHQEVLQHGDAR